ncbi:MAG: GatB/YqeY domain-containing protein [Betaproteobacteria bacterium]|nr:GatB/YqeY domain-containing protein [Betaproteobacteria bacterium]
MLTTAPSALKERITDDMKSAMKAKQAERLSAIRMLLAAIKQKEIDERITLDEASVVAVVDKLIKQRRDSIAAFEQAGRADLVAKETAEVTVLQAYVPARLSADELAFEVRGLLAELGASSLGDMGKVMGAAKQRLAGKADMAEVSALVRASLAG